MPRKGCPASFAREPGTPAPRHYLIYIPTKDNSGRRIMKAQLQDYEDQMSDNFGGSTSWEGRGCYRSDESGKMECEPVKIVTANRIYGITGNPPCADWESDDRFMDGLSRQIMQDLGQEGVAGLVYKTESFYQPGPKLSFARRDIIEYDDLPI